MSEIPLDIPQEVYVSVHSQVQEMSKMIDVQVECEREYHDSSSAKAELIKPLLEESKIGSRFPSTQNVAALSGESGQIMLRDASSPKIDSSLKTYKHAKPASSNPRPTPFGRSRLFLSHFGHLNFDSLKDDYFHLLAKSPSLFRDIKGLDKKFGREVLKLAVIYVGPGQEDEQALLKNDTGSLEYQEFVSSLGWEIDIGTHQGYLGGLERSQATGVKATYFCDPTVEMVFHDSTKLPTDPSDPKQLKKKRHIGNDHIHIVWNEHHRDYRRGTIGGDFGNAQIVVTPLNNGLYAVDILKDSKTPEMEADGVPSSQPRFEDERSHQELSQRGDEVDLKPDSQSGLDLGDIREGDKRTSISQRFANGSPSGSISGSPSAARNKRSKSVSGASSMVSANEKGRNRRLSFQETVEQQVFLTKPEASTKVSTETLKQLRWLRAMGKRHDRTTTHLEKFIRVKVVVDRPPTEFAVIVDQTQSIEYLSHLIEAEYAFRFLLPEKAVEKDYDEAVPDVLPLECGLLYDEEMVSLRYDDKIGEVLDLDSVIHVMNAFEGLQTAIEPKFQAVVTSFMEDVDDDTDDNYVVNPLLTAFRRSSIRNTFKPTPSINSDSLKEHRAEESGQLLSVKEGEETEVDQGLGAPQTGSLERKRSRSQLSGRTYSVGFGTTLDDRLQAVLRNTIALDAFHEFCIDDYSIENLLFWLSVEVFQSSPENLQTSYASFIYNMFISENSPLRINLSQEVIRDINISSKKVVDPMLFDEAQQHIYSVLKGHSFIRFEKSNKLSDLTKLRSTDAEQYKKATITSTYFELFKLPDLFINQISSQFERLLVADQENNTARDVALNEVIEKFFPLSKYLPIEGYFSDPTRHSLVKKKRKIHKEKKISKFFGERPSFEQLQRQLAAANFPQAGIELSLALTLGMTKIGSDEDTGDSFVKRKRAEKLSEFFGANLGKHQLKSQHLAQGNDMFEEDIEDEEENTEQEEDDAEPIETVNELDPDTKRQLTKRNKKLVSILGETNVSEASAKIPSSRSNPNIAGKELAAAALEEAEEEEKDDEGEQAKAPVPLLSIKEASLSTASINSTETSERDIQIMEREMRLKKLRKLSAFLGETTGVIGAAEQQLKKTPLQPARSPMSADEKQISLWRASKLEKVLGEVVPSNLVHTTTDTQQNRRKSFAVNHPKPMSPREIRRLSDVSSVLSNLSTEFHAKTKPAPPIPTFSFTDDDDPSVRILVDGEEHGGDGEGAARLSVQSGKLSRRASIASLHHENLKKIGALLNDNKVDRVLDIMDQMVEFEIDLKSQLEGGEGSEPAKSSPTPVNTLASAKKTNRQRKLQKLNKFFGSKLNTIQLFEQSLVADIEKDLEDSCLDPAEVQVLRSELEAVRAQLALKSQELKKGLEDRAMRELREESTGFSRERQTQAY
ncbi:Ral GTPase-activating protein subunit alpha-2 [Phlyctochytrium planicorne]|nr:Ral GTPase-activating protein subunit alpha-2 [Phlyctochytrium planicorne]